MDDDAGPIPVIKVEVEVDPCSEEHVDVKPLVPEVEAWALDGDDEGGNREGETGDTCLICGALPISQITRIMEKLADSSEDCMDGHLLSMFLLQNLLHLGPQECGELVKKTFGINPGNWYGLCDACGQLVKTGYKLHQQILQLQTKLQAVEETLGEKLKQSLEEEGDETNDVCIVNTRDMIRDYFKGSESAPVLEPNSYSAEFCNSPEDREHVVFAEDEMSENEYLSEEDSVEQPQFFPGVEGGAGYWIPGPSSASEDPTMDQVTYDWYQKLSQFYVMVKPIEHPGRDSKQRTGPTSDASTPCRVRCNLCNAEVSFSTFRNHLKSRHSIDLGRKPYKPNRKPRGINPPGPAKTSTATSSFKIAPGSGPTHNGTPVSVTKRLPQVLSPSRTSIHQSVMDPDFYRWCLTLTKYYTVEKWGQGKTGNAPGSIVRCRLCPVETEIEKVPYHLKNKHSINIGRKPYKRNRAPRGEKRQFSSLESEVEFINTEGRRNGNRQQILSTEQPHKQFTCSDCGIPFTKRKFLNRHIGLYHKNTADS